MNYICKNCGGFIFRERPRCCVSCDGSLCEICNRDLCEDCAEGVFIFGDYETREAKNADIAGK